MKRGWLKRIWYRINPKHKDRLFCTILGTEKYKGYALELYNAVNGSHYTDPKELAIITLELSEERSAVMLEMLTQFDEKSYEEGLREEGRAEERANTGKERLRADEAEKRAEAAEKVLEEHGLL